MAFSAGLVWEVRTTGNAANGGAFRGTATAGTPSAPAVAGSGSGGTVAANTYYVVITYTPGGETRESPKSAETAVTTTGTTSSITVTHPSDPGNSATWNCYVGTASGGPYFPQGTGLAIGSNRVITTTPPTTGTQPPGVDYSQQDSPQVTYTDLVIGASNTLVTSAAFPFTPAHVGNLISVTSGTNFTVQRVEITGVTAAGVATVDKSLGTVAATGGNGKLGGAVDHLSTIVTIVVAGNFTWIKTGTYTITAALAVNVSATTAGNPTTFKGYGTVRGDSGARPLITCSTTTVNLWHIAGGSGIFRFEHLSMSHTGATRGYGLVPKTSTIYGVEVDDCVFDGLLFAIQGDFLVDFVFLGLVVARCEIKNCTSNAIVNGGQVTLIGNYIHDNAGAAWKPGSYSNVNENVLSAIGNVFARNLRGLHDDASAARRYVVIANAFQGQTNEGIYINTSVSVFTNLFLDSNVFYGNGTYGARVDANRPVTQYTARANAYGNNTSGARLNLPAGVGEVTLSGDPFTSSSTGDYTLNRVPGAGLACQGIALALVGGLSSDYSDIGPQQHSDASVPSTVPIGRVTNVQSIGTY